MFIELVDALRCPRPHEDSWLVARAERMEQRHVVEGTLGCPVCRAEYPVQGGVVDLSLGTTRVGQPLHQSGGDDAMRLAAFLGLDDAHGFAVLLGAWGAHAARLRELVECPLLLLDPPDGVMPGPGLSIVRTSGAVPLAAGAARGVALDVADLHGDHPAFVASAVRACRAQGRVVAPASLPLPDGVRELARDAAVWVGERETSPSPLVALHVRRGARGEPPTP